MSKFDITFPPQESTFEDLEGVDFDSLIHEDKNYAGTTHRLDKHTTGVMTMAKSRFFAR